MSRSFAEPAIHVHKFIIVFKSSIGQAGGHAAGRLTAGSLDGAVEEVNEACLHSILATTRETGVEFQLCLH